MKNLADVENYSINHKLESSQQKNQKNLVWENILLHLSANFGLNVQNPHHYRNLVIYSTFGKSALNGLANGLANGLVNGSAVIYSKIQNRLSRIPLATPMD